jgi:GxxExxY protein
MLYKDEVYRIIGAAMEVHRELGPGFLEAVYQEALCLELEKTGIPFEAEKKIRIQYKDRLLEKEYHADVVCYDAIIVELKAMSELTTNHDAQLLNYLKAGKMHVGLLINFGSFGRLEWKRMVLEKKIR